MLDHVSLLEESLAKRGLRLRSICYTPLASDYHPELEVTPELKMMGQNASGICWYCPLGRQAQTFDILLEASFMSTYLAIPREVHLQQVYRMFGYLKLHPKRKIAFDPQHL
jgi:hypothetical protein